VEFDGTITSAYHSNNNEYMAGLKFGGSKGKFGFTGSLIRRNAGNFHTPEVAPFSITQKRGDPKFTGEIDHTDFEQLNGAISLGYLTSLGLFMVNYDHYFNENNFLLPTGGPIGLRLENQVATVKANMPLRNFIVRPKFSFQRNHRQAAKPGESREALPDAVAAHRRPDRSAAGKPGCHRKRKYTVGEFYCQAEIQFSAESPPGS